jgi:hypothetical protein
MNYRPPKYWFVVLLLFVAMLGFNVASGSIPTDIEGMALLRAFSH